jgi:hypothetical protein
MMTLLHQETDPETDSVEWMHPSKANSADNPRWEEGLNGLNRQGFWDACKRELKTLSEDMDAWDVVDRELWMNVLPSTWAFKCK